jgi:hypothetical protein
MVSVLWSRYVDHAASGWHQILQMPLSSLLSVVMVSPMLIVMDSMVSFLIEPAQRFHMMNARGTIRERNSLVATRNCMLQEVILSLLLKVFILFVVTCFLQRIVSV